MLTGENSILQQSGKAKEEFEKASFYEQKQLIISGVQFYNSKSEILSYLTDEFEKLDSTFTVEDIESGYYIKSDNKKILYDYKFNEYKVNEGDEDFWKYTENADGTLTIIGYNSTPPRELVIPNFINDKRVRDVNCYFKDNNELTRVEISYGVESITNTIFSNCANITGEINLPISLKKIGFSAFQNCISITKVTGLDNATDIGVTAFAGCSSLTDISTLDNVEEISNSLFYGCTSLKNIVLGNKVKSIAYAAFYNCSSLESITFGDSVTSIGSLAFQNCTSLTSLLLEGNIRSTDTNAFFNCRSLVTVTVGDNFENMGEGTFRNCPNLKTLKLGKGIKSIGHYAFTDCNSISEIYYNGTSEQYKKISFGIEVSNPTYYTNGQLYIEGKLIKLY